MTTAQNLDVYETFRARGVSFATHCKISNLAIDSNKGQTWPQVGRLTPYPVDSLSELPVSCTLGPAPGGVFFSLGTLLCTAFLGARESCWA